MEQTLKQNKQTKKDNLKENTQTQKMYATNQKKQELLITNPK